MFVFFYFFDVCGFLSYQGVGFRAAMYPAFTQSGCLVGGMGNPSLLAIQTAISSRRRFH
jgi:hypothetical protein